VYNYLKTVDKSRIFKYFPHYVCVETWNFEYPCYSIFACLTNWNIYKTIEHFQNRTFRIFCCCKLQKTYCRWDDVAWRSAAEFPRWSPDSQVRRCHETLSAGGHEAVELRCPKLRLAEPVFWEKNTKNPSFVFSMLSLKKYYFKANIDYFNQSILFF